MGIVYLLKKAKLSLYMRPSEAPYILLVLVLVCGCVCLDVCHVVSCSESHPSLLYYNNNKHSNQNGLFEGIVQH